MSQKIICSYPFVFCYFHPTLFHIHSKLEIVLIFLIWKGNIVFLHVEIYQALHLLGNWIIYQFLFSYFQLYFYEYIHFCLLYPGEFLWDINTEVEFLGQNSERFQKSYYIATDFSLERSNQFAVPRAMYNCAWFPIVLSELTLNFFLSLEPCFANLGMLGGNHRKLHKGKITWQSHYVLA